MSIHVLTGQGAPAVPATAVHLPTKRPRTYPSDTSDAEWRILAPLVPVDGTQPAIRAAGTGNRRRSNRPVNIQTRNSTACGPERGRPCPPRLQASRPDHGRPHPSGCGNPAGAVTQTNIYFPAGRVSGYCRVFVSNS